MSTSRLSALAAVLLLCSGVAADADNFDQYGPDITLAEAKKIAAGALKECEAHEWYMAIAVVDTHGTLVYYEKMDNTELASAKIALDKAGSAAGFKRPTRALGEVLVTKHRTWSQCPGSTARLAGFQSTKPERSSVRSLPAVAPATKTNSAQRRVSPDTKYRDRRCR